MKKLLGKAAFILMMGLAAVSSAKAEFAPQANHPYYLKLKGTEKTLDIEHPKADNSFKNCVGVSEEKTPVFIEVGTGSDAGKFAVRCLQTGKYLSAITVKDNGTTESNWNTYRSDSPYFWTVSEASNGYLVFRQSSYNTNNNKNCLGEQSNYAGILYQDNEETSSTANCYWSLEDAAYDCTEIKVSYKIDGVEYDSYNIWGHNGRPIPSYYSSETFLNGVTTYFQENNNVDIPTSVEPGCEVVISSQYKYSLAFTEDLNNPTYILLKNLRTVRDANYASRAGVTYAATPGNSGQLTLKTTSEFVVDNERYDLGVWWFIKRVGEVDANGYMPVKIYNAYTNKAITNIANGSWTESDDNLDAIWYLKENQQTSGSESYTGFNILHAKSVTNDAYGWNNAGNFGNNVAYWKGNDVGSIWVAELPDADKVEATLAACAAERKAYVDLINSYVENGLFAFSDEQQTAWTTAASAGIKNPGHFNQLMATLHQQVDDAFSGQVADGHDWHVQFLHDQRPVYIGKTSDGVRRGGDEGTRTFTLKNAEDGSGFYIFHEYSNQYVKHPTADNTNISLVSDQSEASIYNFDLSNASKGLVGVKVVGPEGHVDSNCYLHSNGTDDVTNVVRWVEGDNSAWYICFVDEAQAATEYLAGAINISGSLPESSDEVGFLKISSADEAKAAHKAAVALADDAVASEKRAAADAIYSAMAPMEVVLNYPRSGEIYTITSSDGRGSLTANAQSPYIWTTGKPDPVADANKWVVIERDGKKYLYNATVGKFANAYGRKLGGAADGVMFAWIFGDVPSAVEFNGNIFSQPTDGTTRPFVIVGGEDTSVKHRPGMMIINGLDAPVLTVAGYGGEQDGCGFKFVKVEDASEELMASISAAFDTMEAVAAETYEAAKAIADEIPENYADIVNHYNEASVTTFNTYMDMIDEDSPVDKVYGIALDAPRHLSAAALNMTDGFCYSIALAADGKKYHAFYGKASTDEFTPDEGDEIENIYNWHCTIEGNIASFKHILNDEDIKFLLDEVELFTVSAGSKVGQVKLTPFGDAAEAPARRVAALSEEEEAVEAEPEYVLTSMGADAEYRSTSAIIEITAADDAVKVVYDLQGRRLSAPVKGINIINGKKVLIK